MILRYVNGPLLKNMLKLKFSIKRWRFLFLISWAEFSTMHSYGTSNIYLLKKMLKLKFSIKRWRFLFLILWAEFSTILGQKVIKRVTFVGIIGADV